MTDISKVKRASICTGCFCDIKNGLNILDGKPCWGYFKCAECGEIVKQGYSVVLDESPQEKGVAGDEKPIKKARKITS